jgi:rSAM/selenodomain-associated transferase 1
MSDVAAAWTLGIFAKQPRAGLVKSRLAAQTSPAWAARVAEAFLLDLLDRLAEAPVRRVLVYAPADADATFTKLAAGRFALRSQCDGDLGQRLAHFLEQEQQAGADRIVVVGSDSPTLPRAHIAQAFTELEHADVVLGPATDGGYCLLGCGRRLPPIFDGIAWGSERVLLDTVARLSAGGWKLAVLPPWYDVDTLDDWWSLCGHVAALRQAGLDPGVPRTEQLISQKPVSAKSRSAI